MKPLATVYMSCTGDITSIRVRHGPMMGFIEHNKGLLDVREEETCVEVTYYGDEKDKSNVPVASWRCCAPNLQELPPLTTHAVFVLKMQDENTSSDVGTRPRDGQYWLVANKELIEEWHCLFPKYRVY